MAATQPDPSPVKGWFNQIALWGLANAMNSHTALTNSQIAKETGSPVQPIPFGNISLSNNDTQPAPATSGVHPLVAAGGGGALLAAGLGLAKWLAPAAAIPLGPVAPIIAPIVQQAEENIPLIIDWELKNGQQPNGIIPDGPK